MKTITASRKIIVFFILTFASPSFAGELNVPFASVEMGRAILTNRDEFIAALSPFDRAARMKTDQGVAESEFLEFLGRNVLAWSSEETNRMTGVLKAVKEKLAAWDLPVPPNVWLIKTSGREEGNASYTRQNAVILPEQKIRKPLPDLEDTIIHELFHIVSRAKPDLRKQLYRIIGFSPINTVEYPEELRQRKITNPDGVQNGWLINVTNQNQTLPTIAVLYASTSQYDIKKGGEFFDYLVFHLMVLKKDNASWQPKLVGGHPLLLEPRQVSGFFEQVGNNTDYIIHPDEILASNFVRMVNGETNLPTPGIVSEMKKLFSRQRP